MDYFKEDRYWKEHINDKLEEDIWISDYKSFLKNEGKCLDLGCGIGQFSKVLMDYGYEVISADISKLALEKVKEFNKNIVQLDMRKNMPFNDEEFDLVFANLSIHYFSHKETVNLINEIKRILKNDGLFIGSVNSIKGLEKIKDTAKELEKHYYLNKERYIRLFDIDDIKNYLSDFSILKIDEKQTIRFENKKNYIIFIVKK